MDRETKAYHIFITGGNGLLGSHILDLFLRSTDWKIKAFKRSESDLSLVPKSDRITWVEGDLMDTPWLIEEMKSCHCCLHAAGMLSVSRHNKSALKVANVKNTGSVVNAALEAGIERFLHISSVASLGREHEEVIDEKEYYEDHPANTNYSDTKHLGDLEVFRGEAEGLNVSLLRPSLILGSGHWKNGSDGVIKKAFAGVPFYPLGGTGVVDVRDVARLCLKMLKAKDFNFDLIANGHNVTFLQLQKALAIGLNRPAPRFKLRHWMIPLIAWTEKVRMWLIGKKSVVSRQSLYRSQRTYFYNNRLSKESLDMEYRPFKQTIEDCCEAYLKFRNTGEKGRLTID